MRCSSYCATHSATRNARNASRLTHVARYGTLLCATQPDLSQVCDEDCRQMAPKARIVSDKVSECPPTALKCQMGISPRKWIGRHFAGALAITDFIHTDRCAVVPIEIRGNSWDSSTLLCPRSGAVVMASSETLSEHGDGRSSTATFYNDCSVGRHQSASDVHYQATLSYSLYASVMACYRQRLYAQYVEDDDRL